MNKKIKLSVMFLLSLIASAFSAYNSVWYGLVNPSNPTRIPSEIARPWVYGSLFLASIFLCLSIYSLFLLIKSCRNTGEN